MFFTRVGLLGERRGAQPTGLHMTDRPPTATILGRNEQMYSAPPMLQKLRG